MLNTTLTTEPFHRIPDINPGDVIAVGDVHGRSDLLDSFLDYVRGTQTTIILLGDLIDRGDDDAGVLNRVKQLLNDPESWGLQAFYCLRGNHEQLFLDAAEGRMGDLQLWVQNGGNASGQVNEMLKHTDWIEKLPLYMTVGDTLFVHGGVFPGEDPAVTLANGNGDTLLWMRVPFLTCGGDLYLWSDTLKRVVHGHTPEDVTPIVFADRVGIDTGAVYTGVLTAYNATQDTFHQFFDDTGRTIEERRRILHG
jgi:serine/threonine protein phosphatase 1